MAATIGNHWCQRCGEYEHSYSEIDTYLLQETIACSSCGYLKHTENSVDKTKEYLEQEKTDFYKLMDKMAPKSKPFPNLKLKELFNNQQINDAIRQISLSIPKDEDTILICILDGAIPFFADLLKHIGNSPISIYSAKSTAYSRTHRSEETKIHLNFDPQILKDKNVFLVDDVYDRGSTLRAITSEIKSYPKSIKWICLIKKVYSPENQFPEMLNTNCLTIGKEFIVGYGLDWDGYYRNYNSIYEVIQDANP